ncbi:unnamed protein product, partial [Laminaria digitata]
MPLRRRNRPAASAFALAYGALAAPSWPVLLAKPPTAACAFGGGPSPAFVSSSAIPVGSGGGSRRGDRSALRPRSVGRHQLAGDGTSRRWRLRPKLLHRSTFDRCYASFRDQDDEGAGAEEQDD